jgi:B-cell receptor-associated protein 31
MSLTWALIAGYLYVEIAIVLLLVLPIFSASKWNRFFKSRFLAVFSRQAQIYFYLALGVLTIFLLESIREIQKYSSMEEDTTLNMGLQHQLRLFRAQRNFYICGFSMFLSLVIRRLVTLISAQANLIANSEASMKQAQSATAAARTMMQNKPSTGEDEDDEKKALKEQVKLLKDELQREQKDKEAMKSQSESLNREYDRLTAEYSKLQNKVDTKSGGKSD